MASRFATKLLLFRCLSALRRARPISSILVASVAPGNVNDGYLFSPPEPWLARDPQCVSRLFFFARPSTLDKRQNPTAIDYQYVVPPDNPFLFLRSESLFLKEAPIGSNDIMR
ncbi:hypothetical protein MUK42_02324 [Musa troglodytarum]|uniref:Secreted protein n=1 Tax=Musa troglodytarum TaxID=320322 RepID=A0A9E7FV24_9LILI|nr:hypothetical protein MUK42_02324 [Musa troglodytarum]